MTLIDTSRWNESKIFQQQIAQDQRERRSRPRPQPKTDGKKGKKNVLKIVYQTSDEVLIDKERENILAGILWKCSTVGTLWTFDHFGYLEGPRSRLLGFFVSFVFVVLVVDRWWFSEAVVVPSKVNDNSFFPNRINSFNGDHDALHRWFVLDAVRLGRMTLATIIVA